jgi:hypothetical protein
VFLSKHIEIDVRGYILKNSELIEILKQYPEDAEIGYYSENAYNRGDAAWSNKIVDVEKTYYKHGNGYKIVIVGGPQ